MADTNNQNSFLDYAGLALFWSNIKKIIEDNELVTATALTDLDTRVDTLEGLPSTTVISKTYSELVALKGNYIPGQQYRITDYVTTTSQDYTQAAGHQFDLIVTADDESTLNENTRAIQHEGDTYFANSDLSAWEIKYCIDNDTERFAWADSTNGKGVIYYMKDEYGNECPYDFKNIMFIRYQLEAPLTSGYSEQWITQLAINISNQFNNNQLSYIWGGIDEYARYWEYDYEECYSTNTGTTKAFYTFSNIIDDNVSDKSITKYCYNNVINEYISSWKLCLNNNVFFYTSTSSGCYNNSFGNDCNSTSFGNGCYNNSFGNDCDYNSFGNGCFKNSFGNDCYSNSFGNGCYSNSFGDECYSNSFGNDCYYNSFGHYCFENSFGNNCNSTSFGNVCFENSFGNDCSYNSFGNDCFKNSFGNDCTSNSFGNDCHYNSFRVSGDNTSSLISYCRYNAFDDGCSYNIIYSANTNSSNYLENYHINRGVKGTYGNPMLIDAQYLNAENVCNVYKKGDVAVVAYIQY